VLELMVNRLEESLYYLGGAAPTANAYFYTGRAVNNVGFVVGDMVLIDTASRLRWDEKLKLKEDYDFTAQHIARHGGVARSNDILAEFVHRSNAGGAVDFRNEDEEQRAIRYLREKWGKNIFPDNKKRPNEILFRWPARRG
jgi:hypothetical protein